MASAFSLKVAGLDRLQKKFNALPLTLAKEIDGEIETTCQKVVLKAKQAAPKDLGKLGQGIGFTKTKAGTYEIFSSASYSPFVEFGTRGKVQVPAELTSYAQQFRGTGTGDFYDFVNAILDWVKRKGLAEITNSYTGRKSTKRADLFMVAEAVAWSILKKGIKPHPFFFPAWFDERPKLGKAIKDVLRKRGLA
jgi:hypothetical protein